MHLLMNEMEHSRLEDALDTELRNTRKEASDLCQKLHILLQEKIDLESKWVPFRVKVADLEAARKAEASRVERRLSLSSPKLVRKPQRLLQSLPKLGVRVRKLLKNLLELMRRRKD